MNPISRNLSLYLIFLSFYLWFSGNLNRTQISNSECINAPVEQHLPITPWQSIRDIPPELRPVRPILIPENIVAYRKVGGIEELWLSSSYLNNLIYNITQESWQTVSLSIADTPFIVPAYRPSNIFITKNNQVWGIVQVNQTTNSPMTVKNRPILSRFNEETHQFDLIDGMFEIAYNAHAIILQDKSDNFWVLVEKDAIYRYDPRLSKTTKIVDLPKYKLNHAIILPDETLYFLARYEEEWNLTAKLYRYSEEEGVIAHINIPIQQGLEIHGTTNGLLFDKQNRLWIGDSGYFDQVGIWTQLYPVFESFLYYGDLNLKTDSRFALFNAPEIMFESSDGRLWYNLFLDNGGRWGEGVFWYNPETMVGCKFTTFPTYIVEDQQRYLWIAIEGTLYRNDPDKQNSGSGYFVR